MAVEIAGTCLHCSQPPLLRGPLSAKTVALAISSLLHSPSTISHHRTLFLGTALLHYSHQTGIAIIAGRRRRPLSSSIAALGSCENNHEDDQFAIESQTDHYAKTIHSTHANSDSDSDSPPSSSSSPGIDAFALQEMERRASRSDLPLSLRILKRKKKRRESSSSSSSSSSVKKAFSSMVLIVRELQSQVIRMRQALFSSDPRLRIHNTLARVHSELHASFVWLFHRIFSSTPTLMISLMLLLANFTLFSITDHYSFAFAAAAAPLPPTQSAPEESPTAPRFINPSALKSFSACRSAAVGGGGDGSGKPPAIAGAAGDGCSDRPPSSSGRGGTISVEEISMAASAWRRMVEETEAMRACERHEVLLDPDTLRRFVSPVTAEVEPDDLSGYAATELSYRVALAENPEDALLLCNFAQFLFSVLRDHDR